MSDATCFQKIGWSGLTKEERLQAEIDTLALNLKRMEALFFTQKVDLEESRIAVLNLTSEVAKYRLKNTELSGENIRLKRKLGILKEVNFDENT